MGRGAIEPLRAIGIELHWIPFFGKRERCKRISDEVQRSADGASLHIASCRPKEWNQLTTVSYGDELYELVRTKEGVAPRPFVYILRKKPEMAVILGIYYYDPDEVLEAGS